MMDGQQELENHVPETTDHLGAKSAAICLGVVVALGVGYTAAGYKADSNYGVERAAQLIEETQGSDNPHFISKDIGLETIGNGCPTLSEVKYNFEVTHPNGSVVKMAVCRGLLKKSIVIIEGFTPS